MFAFIFSNMYSPFLFSGWPFRWTDLTLRAFRRRGSRRLTSAAPSSWKRSGSSRTAARSAASWASAGASYPLLLVVTQYRDAVQVDKSQRNNEIIPGTCWVMCAWPPSEQWSSTSAHLDGLWGGLVVSRELVFLNWQMENQLAESQWREALLCVCGCNVSDAHLCHFSAAFPSRTLSGFSTIILDSCPSYCSSR